MIDHKARQTMCKQQHQEVILTLLIVLDKVIYQHFQRGILWADYQHEGLRESGAMKSTLASKWHTAFLRKLEEGS